MSARKNRAPTSSIFAERFSRESITNLLPYSTSSTTRMPSHSVRLRITRTINRSWKFAERPPVPAAWRSRCPFCRKSPSVEIFDVGQIPLQRDERLSLDRFFFIDNSVTGRLSNIIFYRQQIDREKLLAQGTGDSRINQSQILRMSIINWCQDSRLLRVFFESTNFKNCENVWGIFDCRIFLSYSCRKLIRSTLKWKLAWNYSSFGGSSKRSRFKFAASRDD